MMRSLPFLLHGEQLECGPIYAIRIPFRTLCIAGLRSYLCLGRVYSRQDSRSDSGPQHFAFICNFHLQLDESLVLDVYPVLPFSNTSGGLATDNRMNYATATAALLPLSSRHPTPDTFGKPLDFGNWSATSDSFLHVFPTRFTMPTKRSFKRMDPPLLMPYSVLRRIGHYREYLLSTTITQNNDGDEPGKSNLPHGRTGDRGGQVASGVTSVTSPQTIISGGEGERATGVGLEQFSDKLDYDSLPSAEDVDEDADDGDATTLDDLLLLVHDNPTLWIGELKRYLQEEKREQERVQDERMARLASWREDVAI